MSRAQAVLLSAALLALFSSAFSPAAAAPATATVLRFQHPPEFTIGEEIELVLLLETESGRPLPYQRIEINLDGELAGSVETDAFGAARLVLGRPLAPGRYLAEAFYDGFQTFTGSSAQAMVIVDPAELAVHTVPEIAGLPFSLGGEVQVTGTDGIARFSIDRAGAYDLALQTGTGALEREGAVFIRWWPEGLETSTQIIVAGDTRVQAGFELSFTADFVFVDPDGETVPSDRIDSARLRGSDGSSHFLGPGETLQLRSNRILARLNGLDSVAVIHSVQSVIVDGVEVVNRGQQRFIHSLDRPIEIELLFFDVTFFSRSILMGRPIAGQVELTFPDGAALSYPLDESGAVALHGLPRGEYQARLLTDAGLAPGFPVVLSRDQEIRLPVISRLDLIAGAILSSALIIGLPVFGRRRQILGSLAALLGHRGGAKNT